MGAVTSGGMKKEEENLCQTKMFPIELTKRLGWQQRNKKGCNEWRKWCHSFVRSLGASAEGTSAAWTENPAQEKGGRLNEQHDPATGGVCWRLTFRWKRAEQKSAELVSSSYLQVFLGALTPDEMKKREREREKIKVGRLKTTNTQIEVRVVCLRRVCLTAVCSRASLTGVSFSLFVSHHLDRITTSFLVRNFFPKNQKQLPCV